MKNPKRSLIILATVILLGAIAAWVAVRQLRQASLAQNDAAFDAFAVRRMDLSDKIDVTGDVVTEKNAAIYPPYSATVKEILVKPGVIVHQGQVLLKLQLKDTDLINYTSSWKSSLEQARANLATARQALEREEILYKVQGATIDDVEAEQIKVRQYQAQVAEYRQKLDSLTKNGIDNNGDVLIKAPFDAEVSWINVKLEESVTTTTELLTLGGNSAIRIEASVDQGDIDQIEVGLPATIKANDQNRTVISGIVTSFGSTGTTTSNVVTFPVIIKPLGSQTAALSGPENGKNATAPRKESRQHATLSGQKGRFAASNQPASGSNPLRNDPAVADSGDSVISLLKSGMTVDVSIMAGSHANVLAVPLTAVTEQNGRSTVKILENGKPVTQEVQLGYKSTLYAEVLSGLSAGDQVALPKADGNSGANPSRNGGSGGRRQGGMMGGPMGPM